MIRGATPLRSAAPSLQASNQSQIDDLVQRNRTLEYTVQKLSEKLSSESERSTEAISDIQKRWQVEQSEWRQGCDVLQSCHRVVQLRNVVELEKERMNVLKELDVSRREKLQRLQRDFRITMFQARETELEEQIADLEEEKDSIILEHDTIARRLKGKHSEYEAQLQAKDDHLAVAEQEREELQEKLTEIREEHAQVQVSNESLTSQLERANLQLEGAQTRYADLERINDELKRTNADINRQLEKWQNLETKGGAEMEALRRKRIELEVLVKDLQAQLEKSNEESTRALEKEKRRIEKLKEALQLWQADSKQHEQDSEEAEKKLATAVNKNNILKAELEAERARVRQLSSEKQNTPVHDVSGDEDNQVQDSPLVAPPPAKPKARSRQAKATPKDPTPVSENAEAGPSKTVYVEEGKKPVKPRRKNKAASSDVEAEPAAQKSKPKKKATITPEEVNSDVEEVPQKSQHTGKAKAVQETQDEVEIVVPHEPPAKKRQAKRKAKDNDSDVEVVEPVKANTAKSIKPSRARDTSTKPQRRKPTSRSESASLMAGSTRRNEEPEKNSDADEAGPKKKRRKINIFGTASEPTVLNFTPGEGSNHLQIPTMLSPVKESEVPSRSTSGSMLVSIGSLLKSSFSRR